MFLLEHSKNTVFEITIKNTFEANLLQTNLCNEIESINFPIKLLSLIHKTSFNSRYNKVYGSNIKNSL